MPFEVTPVMLHLTRVETDDGVKAAPQFGGSQWEDPFLVHGW